MTNVVRYKNNSQAARETITEFDTIVATLSKVGILFERWEPKHHIKADAVESDVIEAYRSDIDRICEQGGYQSVDCIRVTPTHPDKVLLREKFLREHTHSEDEVRFFVEGSGLFYLHIDDNIYGVLCTQGDFIGVPKGVTHWFDMGPEPNFTALRFFTNPDGWIAHFTGSDIASRYPKMLAR